MKTRQPLIFVFLFASFATVISCRTAVPGAGEAPETQISANAPADTVAERIDYFQIANYDESLIPPYTLPDPLVMEDGTPVRNARQWRRRRAEIYELAQQEMYGHMPPRPRREHFRLLSEDKEALGGLATAKRVQICPDRQDSVSFELQLYIPNGYRRPVPAFLGLTFGEDDGWPLETILKAGYAVGTVAYQDIVLDKSKATVNGVLPYGYHVDPEHAVEGEWGTIAAWSWGMSRALDYLEKDRAVDARKVAAIGHSRLGKVALWAAASDTRFAMAVANNSGCCGAALSRRRIGETFAAVCQYSPQWFSPSFRKYREREDALPFDQHEIIALIAPRPVYIASASEDEWADPRGEYLSALAAAPVFDLLAPSDRPALSDCHARPDRASPDPSGWPLPGTVATTLPERLAYHLRQGPHAITAWDWERYLAFADRWLK